MLREVTSPHVTRLTITVPWHGFSSRLADPGRGVLPPDARRHAGVIDQYRRDAPQPSACMKFSATRPGFGAPRKTGARVHAKKSAAQ